MASSPKVSIFIREDDVESYDKSAENKFGKWEGGKKVSSGSWDEHGLTRSMAYSVMVREGYIVTDIRELIEKVQQARRKYEGFMIVPINEKPELGKKAILGNDN